MSDEKAQKIIRDLPEPESAIRFLGELEKKFPHEHRKLLQNEGLLADVLTIVSFSPLLATTLLQHKSYFSWLDRQRTSAKVRGKEELLESLARFALTNSTLETNVLLARFRRRELLRIYLLDIRNLETIAEITEELSNLADACLEYALRIARQELDNRFGAPLELDSKGRARQADFCIVALGKLGSRELNYSSDIDLLFLYSSEGQTSGHGTRGSVTNREYFVKLAESVIKLIGQQSGEGAAYRVDMRLRPHGRVGALAVSLNEAAEYYQKSAQSWERQVLIRSRASAGNAEIFHDFYRKVENFVFSKNETVENALRNVRLSKEKINLGKTSEQGFDVKLGKGGIREIEFIAQALQLAYGGRDEWLRISHTLISLSRLADRRLIYDTELAELSEAYKFLRKLEHHLQMENGLQTHLVPNEEKKRLLIARKMGFRLSADFDRCLKLHTDNVHQIFNRIFSGTSSEVSDNASAFEQENAAFSKLKTEIPSISFSDQPKVLQNLLSSLKKADSQIILNQKHMATLKKLAEISPFFTEMLIANPSLINDLPTLENTFTAPRYKEVFFAKVFREKDFANQIAVLRKIWARFLLEIVISDIFGKISLQEAKKRQTELAEASVETAIGITRCELEKRFSVKLNLFPFAVLGLGRLGSRGLDYGSDLDLVLIYDDEVSVPHLINNPATFYAKAVEIFVTSLSAMTRDGSLYRVDLRLRPDGKNGPTSLGKASFLNYLRDRAAIWEWLAYVKIRAVSGAQSALLAAAEARKIIHQRALQADKKELKTETQRIRERLREQKAGRLKDREIDIKFDEGGMLDVYFAMRYLQLRDNIPDDEKNRSTIFMLRKLFENKSLSVEDYKNFSEGYSFLSEIDHYLRLTVGRSTRLPLANRDALQIISARLKLDSINHLTEKLTFHRLNIRHSFENVLKN